MNDAIEFDFAAKKCQCTTDPVSAVKQGRPCWVDVTVEDPETPKRLAALGLSSRSIEAVLSDDPEGRYDIYPDCIHVAVGTVTIDRGDADMKVGHLDVLLANNLLVTIHRGPSALVQDMEKTYKQDFESFAKTLSFLLFELFDHLTENYKRAIRNLEVKVERFQARIFAKVDDEIFSHVGAATRELLHFRSILLSARDVLHELATRKSPYVAETAQPFLHNIVGTLERLSADLAVEREVLTETLNLYMGIVSHRTNKVVNRLTVLSMIFLPLTFLCGVYGMNFKTFPELEWEWAYPMFWVIVVSIVAASVAVMRRWGWI